MTTADITIKPERMFVSRQKYIRYAMNQKRAWRVAVTRDEDANGPWHLALEEAGFEPVSMPIIVEGPPPDQARLADAANHLDSYDWVICASARSVRALSDAGVSRWPAGLRTAAVGVVTAAAMRSAGADRPIYAEAAGARALWDRLRNEEAWTGKRVLIATVPGGRRELIDGLRAEGASVDAIDCYSMQVRAIDDIKRDWDAAQPEALLLASPSVARTLIAVIGAVALRELKAVVPIGVTTTAELVAAGIEATPPAQTTFEAVVDRLVALREQQNLIA